MPGGQGTIPGSPGVNPAHLVGRGYPAPAPGETIRTEPFPVTPAMVADAIRAADDSTPGLPVRRLQQSLRQATAFAPGMRGLARTVSQSRFA